MNISCKNIYKLARDIAGLTREESAELLNIAPRTLAYYESASCDPKTPRPSAGMVDQMIEVYKTKWLAYLYFQTSTELGKKYLPEINLTDNVAELVLTFQKELWNVKEVDRSLVTIASDGKIDNDEKEEWGQTIEKVGGIARAALSLMFVECEDNLEVKEKSPMAATMGL